MFAAKTRFGLYDEPELLPINRTTTAPDLDQQFHLVVENLDDVIRSVDAWAKLLTQHTMLTDWTGRATAFNRPAWWDPSTFNEWFAHRRDGDNSRSVKSTNEAAQRLDSQLYAIQGWLGVGLDRAAEMAGISRGTVYAWRARDSKPRPATTGAVVRIHGLIAGAVNAVGVESTRTWFRAGEHPPLDELLKAGGDPARLSAVSARLRRELLRVPAPPPNRALAATIADIVE